MALSSWNITRSSMILWEGDSLSDRNFPYQMLNPIWEDMWSHYSPSTSSIVPTGNMPSEGYGRPALVNKAINGSQIGTINARIDAELAQNPYTHVVLCIGTNERALARATTQANIATLVGKFTTQKILVIGPYAMGEKWPTGENDIVGAADDRLDETEIDLVNGFAGYANSMVIGIRNGGGSTTTTGLYLTTMPPLNTPSPGQSIGPFTNDGCHWMPRGRAEVYNIVRPFVSFG